MSDHVTADQVRKWVEAAGLHRIETRDCSICGYGMAYLIQEGQVYYDAGCNCSRYPSRPHSQSWDDIANWINIQRNEEVRDSIKAKCGYVREMHPGDIGITTASDERRESAGEGR